jgi:hypothetical protein
MDERFRVFALPLDFAFHGSSDRRAERGELIVSGLRYSIR